MPEQQSNEVSNCLNCKYEPKWQAVARNSKQIEVRCGTCRWVFLGEMERALPLYTSINLRHIEHVLTDKGVGYHCPAWKAAEQTIERGDLENGR